MRTLRGGSPKSRSHNTYQLNVVRDGQKKGGDGGGGEWGFRVIMVIIMTLVFLQSCQ
ncbi:hypothetical protein HS371_16 [Klebsiella phage vB_KpP_HS37]|nr:hypothetical protein HS371_16 [Klebsiella phage vB_KpP_HS37]